MKRQYLVGLLVVLCTVSLLTATVSSSAPGSAAHRAGAEAEKQQADVSGGDQAPATVLTGLLRASGAMIIDHTCTDLSQVPDYWIEQAKALLRVSYGHTSHGSQPVTGMTVLENNTPSGLYDFNTNGAVTPDVLSLADRVPGGDLGSPDRVTWEALTRTYLNGAGSDRNVVVWSWCGQVSSATAADMETYLNLMNGLEQEYPNVTFVYMTGHLDGGGLEGNLNLRNEQIRQYCEANNKILFDFADIESYDPDGAEFLSKDATDSCNYSCGSATCNWADQWCAAHSGDPLCGTCSCAHSKPLNCNLKGRAFWWMMARIAGWPGRGEPAPQKSPSAAIAYFGEVVTYTVEVRGLDAPPEATVFLTDVVPAELEYVPGSLQASTGVVDDASAPTLYWSGVLDPSPVVLVTYAVTVTASGPGAAINTAVMDAPEYDSAQHSSTLLLNPLPTYLPLAARLH
ncbi:MAG TPA: DUF11 domain-containing protein [Anaerolineae bacterium]|nr:DUF11 domain-containing protein [Anaerolineae bacterium]